MRDKLRRDEVLVEPVHEDVDEQAEVGERRDSCNNIIVLPIVFSDTAKFPHGTGQVFPPSWSVPRCCFLIFPLLSPSIYMHYVDWS